MRKYSVYPPASTDRITPSPVWILIRSSNPAPQPQLLAPPPQIVTRCERRMDRPLWMVLMGHRCAKQRNKVVPKRIHHVAVILMHGVDHELKRRVDDRVGFFGVQLLHQLGRAREDGVQRGDGLPRSVNCFGRRAIGRDYDLRFSRRNGRGCCGFCGAICRHT